MKIDFSKLNQQQVLNLEAAVNAYNKQETISSASPTVLYIELTQNCISRCRFCKRDWSNNSSYDMDKKLWNILLTDYIPYAVFVDFNGWGESLMIPDIDRYIDQAARCGVKIKLTTTLGCGSQKVLQSLIDNDVYVSVSFDAVDRKAYENIRRGVSYNTVIKNIEFLTTEMKKKGTLQDNIKLSIAPLQNSNLGQIAKIVDFAKRYGITQISLTPLFASPFNFNLLKYHKYKTIKELSNGLESAKKHRVSIKLNFSLFKEFCIADHAFNLCCHPWLYAFINYKGYILPCDHMVMAFFIKHAIGHVSSKKENVWNGEKARFFRSEHIKKNMKKLASLCQKCYDEGRYADHEHEIHGQFSKWLVSEKELGARISCFNK